MDAGFPEPWLNYLLHRTDGSFIARVDMAFPRERVVLEYEGDAHRSDKDVWARDIHRREDIEDLGWRVIRVTAADLRSPTRLLTRLTRFLPSKRE